MPGRRHSGQDRTVITGIIVGMDVDSLFLWRYRVGGGLMLRETMESLLPIDIMLYLLMFALLFTVTPAMLIASLLGLAASGPRATHRESVAFGLAVAIWTNACWLLAGYFGVYPNLPAALVATLALGWSTETCSFDLMVIAMNFLIWPFAAWIVVRIARTGQHHDSGVAYG
jgi:hypothetical protein